ncbi:MAG: DUF971 domain-containing protein [Chloroflexota bacterium]
MAIRPTGVKADRNERVLKITWDDGRESVYPFAGLRAACPCVSCKGGHDNMGGPANPALVRDAPDTGVTVNNLQAVGAYALQFFWSDGHDTGIYTWDFLRQSDPALAEEE